jgi:hypothetical protein
VDSDNILINAYRTSTLSLHSAHSICNFESFWKDIFDSVFSCKPILPKRKSSSLIINGLEIFLVDGKTVNIERYLFVGFPYAVPACKRKREEFVERNLSCQFNKSIVILQISIAWACFVVFEISP